MRAKCKICLVCVIVLRMRSRLSLVATLAEIYFIRLEDLLINCFPLEGPKDISLSNTISSGLIREFQASLKNSSIFYPL